MKGERGGVAEGKACREAVGEAGREGGERGREGERQRRTGGKKKERREGRERER